MFDIISVFIFLKTEKENVRTNRILMHFLGTSQWNSWHLIKGGHTNNAIPKDRWPRVGLFGGTMEPLGCDVPFKDRMCLNFLFVWRCVFEGRWKAVVFMDEFLWSCVFWVFYAFFGWLRQNMVIFKIKSMAPVWNSDLEQINCERVDPDDASQLERNVEKSHQNSFVATLPRTEPFQR